MLKVAIGHREMVDVEDIVDEIIDQAEDGLDGAEPKVAIVCAAADLDCAEILNALQEKWPGLQVVGCTTDGESPSQPGFVDDSIAIGFFASDDIDITVGAGRDTSLDIRKAAEAACAQVRAMKGAKTGLGYRGIPAASLTPRLTWNSRGRNATRRMPAGSPGRSAASASSHSPKSPPWFG